MLKYLFIIISLLNSLFSEEKKFDDYDNVEKIFQAYVKAVDEKNIDKMLKYIHVGGGPKTIFHFGENPPIVVRELDELKQILTVWKNSPNSNFHRTRLDTVNIAPRYDWLDERICTVDVTYSRLGDSDEFISQKRSVYHFYRAKNSGIIGFFKKWEKWKIYMLVDVEVEPN
tara:strand:+ start:190 stop:702 length:513 start_codon:yes stop_codon:yes gene_type:complete